jgi:hypothetical protein
MKKRILILLFLFSGLLSAQNTYIVEKNGHQIKTNDSLAGEVLEEFFYYADRARVDYLTELRDLKEIQLVTDDKTFIGDQKNGLIRINNYADQFPQTKRILILHQLGRFYGVKPSKGSSYKVMNENFRLDSKTEQVYQRRRIYEVDIKELMVELELARPLNTRINRKK